MKANVELVTVTMPDDLIELNRRRRAELRRSLLNPHPESAELTNQGFDGWFRTLSEEDGEALVNNSIGQAVRWIPGEGWVEDPK